MWDKLTHIYHPNPHLCSKEGGIFKLDMVKTEPHMRRIRVFSTFHLVHHMQIFKIFAGDFTWQSMRSPAPSMNRISTIKNMTDKMSTNKKGDCLIGDHV